MGKELLILFNFKKIALGSIIFLALILRVYNLDTNPPGLTWDEAALGYNAYSILKTGRDEYGEFLPLILKSFGDYKPAIYTYTIIPFVAVLGLTETAVRIPSVLAGLGFVIVLYFLIKELFKNEWLAISVSLMAAISPLGLQFSRPGFESNLALFLNSLGLLFLVKGSQNSRNYIWSAVFFGVSLFTYQASKMFVPMFLIGSFFILRDKIKIKDPKVLISVFLISVFALIMVVITFGLGQADRLSSQNFFAYKRSWEDLNRISNESFLRVGSLEFEMLHGEWFAYTRGLFERYLVYFSPVFLFILGDYSPRHSVPDLGVLLYISLVFIPLGFVYLLKNFNRGASIILFWLSISIIPAVLSRDLISMVRALNMLLPLVILEGAGLYLLISYIRKLKPLYSYGLLVVLIFAFVFNYFVFLDRYFIHAPKEYSFGWLYGYKQVFEKLNGKDLSKYNKVVMSDDYGQPYIYYLFYTKYDPSKLQSQIVLDKPTVDVGTVRRIDNIEFRPIYWPNERGDKNSLFIGPLMQLPDQDVKPFAEYKIFGEIHFLDNQHAFRIVEINE